MTTTIILMLHTFLLLSLISGTSLCMVGVETQLARMGPCSPYTLVWDPARRQGRTLLKFYILERTKHYKYFIIIFQGPTQVSRVHPWRIGPHPGERGPIPSIRIFPDWSYLGN